MPVLLTALEAVGCNMASECVEKKWGHPILWAGTELEMLIYTLDKKHLHV